MVANLHLVPPPAWADAIARSTNLVELEAIVAKGRETFLEVGMALMRIHQAELYKSTHSTWEGYCQQRWGWSRQHAYRLMLAARVAEEVSPVGDIDNERVARELAKAPEGERQQLLLEAQDLAGGPPTAAQVQEARERRVDGKEKPPALQDRRTPRWLFDHLSGVFGPFVLDAYAASHNALCAEFNTAEHPEGFAWRDVTFANPPFEDMGSVLDNAIRWANAGIRSIVLGPVGCSQDWYHRLAIQGTVYVPDRRITFDTPDGKPTGVRQCHNGLDVDACRKACRCVNGADRDTIVMAFGEEHRNSKAAIARGEFRVLRLELPEATAP